MELNVPIQIRRGTAAQMPAAMLSGELYFQTDTNGLYAGTGVGVVAVGGGGGVTSFNSRTGAVEPEDDDYSSFYDASGAAAAALASAETYANSLAVNYDAAGSAATAQSNAESFATSAVATETSRAEAAEALLAPKASPTFTGTVSGITAAMVGADAAGSAATAQSNAESFATSQGYITTPSGAQNLIYATPNGSSGNASLRALVAADIPTLNQNTTGSSGSCTGNSATATTAVNLSGSQSANLVYASPNGSSGTGSWRALVAADIPTLNQNTTGSSGSCTGNAATATTAVNLSGSQTANYVYASPNGTSGTGSWRALVAADIPTLNQNTTGSSGSCTGNSATATTAVNLSGSQTANYVYASPNGSSGTGSWRALVAGDLPTTGTWAFAGTLSANLTLSGNPAFTGTPTFSNPIALGSSTATTQTALTNNTTIATTAYVNAAVTAGANTYSSGFSGFWGGAALGHLMPGSSSTSSFVANQGNVYLFYLSTSITITKATIYIAAASSSTSLASAGIYTISGTRLVNTGTWNMGTVSTGGLGPGAFSNSFSSTTLTPGWYYYMFTQNGTATVAYWSLLSSTDLTTVMNNNGVRFGLTTATTNGAQPTSLGTVTASETGDLLDIPGVFFE